MKHYGNEHVSSEDLQEAVDALKREIVVNKELITKEQIQQKTSITPLITNLEIKISKLNQWFDLAALFIVINTGVLFALIVYLIRNGVLN